MFFSIILGVNPFCIEQHCHYVNASRVLHVFSENKMETDPGREYDSLEDVPESAAYKIPGIS